MDKGQALTFDDILLVPQYSERSHPIFLVAPFCSRSFILNVPVFGSDGYSY